MHSYAKVLALSSIILHRLEGIAACTVSIENHCGRSIELYDNARIEMLDPSAASNRVFAEGMSNMLRVGMHPDATLAEFANSNNRCWYDVSAIPTGGLGPQNCKSKAECMTLTGGTGFNVPMAIYPAEADQLSCKNAVCLDAFCADAYLFPSDDLKTRSCPGGTTFRLVLCPAGDGSPAPPTISVNVPLPTAITQRIASDSPVRAPQYLKDEGESRPETAAVISISGTVFVNPISATTSVNPITASADVNPIITADDVSTPLSATNSIVQMNAMLDVIQANDRNCSSPCEQSHEPEPGMYEAASADKSQSNEEQPLFNPTQNVTASNTKSSYTRTITVSFLVGLSLLGILVVIVMIFIRTRARRAREQQTHTLREPIHV